MACSIVQNDRSLERPEKWKRHFLKTSGMFYFAERQDVSVQRPERWKRYFPKINGMFYFAERQEPRAPRKMETLAEDHWHVLLRRTTRPQRATPRKMETLFSEAQLHVRLCRSTEAVGETPTSDVRIGCSTFARRVFLWEALRENTTFDWG